LIVGIFLKNFDLKSFKTPTVRPYFQWLPHTAAYKQISKNQT